MSSLSVLAVSCSKKVNLYVDDVGTCAGVEAPQPSRSSVFFLHYIVHYIFLHSFYFHMRIKEHVIKYQWILLVTFKNKIDFHLSFMKHSREERNP